MVNAKANKVSKKHIKASILCFNCFFLISGVIVLLFFDFKYSSISWVNRYPLPFVFARNFFISPFLEQNTRVCNPNIFPFTLISKISSQETFEMFLFDEISKL